MRCYRKFWSHGIPAYRRRASMDSHDSADQATTGAAERNQCSATCDSATSASAVMLVAVTMTLVLAWKRTLANFWLETELTLL